MKHDWIKDEWGDIKRFYGADDQHGGPECRRCGRSGCEWCDRQMINEPCPSNQLDLPLELVVE